LRIAVAGLLVSGVIAFVLSSRYESTTRLMPPDQGSTGMATMLSSLVSNSGTGGFTLGGLGADLLGLKSSGELFVAILKSRTVQDDLIVKFDLRKIYGDRRWEDTRKELAINTDIGEDRKSGIITIGVTDKSPQRAAAMAQEYVEELNRVVTDLNTSSAHRERVFLEERLAQARQDLESAEKDFSQFASKNTAIDIQAQGKSMIEAAGALEGQLIATQTELEGLKQIYSDGNVRVRATQARVDELQRQLQKLGGKFDDAAPSEGGDPQPIYPSLRQLPILGVSYADLVRRTKVQEAIFETLTREYELAKVEEAKETPSVKVLDPADVPEKKSFPPRLLIILAGIAIFIAAGIAWVLLKAAWQEVDQQDPRKALAQEVWDTARARVLLTSPNGSILRGISGSVMNRSHKGSTPPDDQ
jgi:uncharacterized protein involved in exopolysaccharide biosynthesis